MGERPVHVVINRQARHLRSEGPLLSALRRGAPGVEVHETRSLDELGAIAQAIATGGAAAVVLAGGDGAYMAGVSALAAAFARRGDELPPVALAPGGTVSTTARNWGLRGPVVRYARELVGAVARGTAVTTSRPTLRVRDERGGDRVGFIWGAGLVARFFDAYYARPRAGYLAAAGIVARIFVESPVGGPLARRVLTPVPCEVRVDGAVQSARGFSLMASSVVHDLGLHMRVLYRATEDPERIHFVASPLGARLLGPQMPLVLAGKRLRGKDHVDTLAREVSVRFDAQDAYVLDGEVFAAREVRLTPGPRLRVLSV